MIDGNFQGILYLIKQYSVTAKNLLDVGKSPIAVLTLLKVNSIIKHFIQLSEEGLSTC